MKEIYTISPDSLVDWYWEFGAQREGDNILSLTWLDTLTSIARESYSVYRAETEYQKPTMALWGPSQSGKSTMLACFIDGEDDQAAGSALSWNGGNARFVGDDEGGKVAVLNPFSFGSDASGCVTRFRLQTEVKYPDYPVEITFADDSEVLLYLAVGYVNETKARNGNDKEVHWSETDVLALGKACGAPYINSERNKEAFKLLISLLNVVDVLVEMEFSRYINLKKTWGDTRRTLLNTAGLANSETAVVSFITALLWDSWKNLSDVYSRLRAKRAELGDKPVYSSIEMAALMLNIASARQYNIPVDIVKDRVDCCCLQTMENGDVALTRGEKGKGIFRDGEDFALAQGLVSLIVVPLRSEVIRAHNKTVHKLLETADLVDFPGVANEHSPADRLSDEKLALSYKEDEKCPLYALTKVMMRGKTASIVVSSSRNLNIDLFSLLARMPSGPLYPAQPKQLKDGINCWFRYMGKDTSNGLPKDKDLPINLVLTFASSLVKQVKDSGIGPAGLDGVFSKIRSMGDLGNPEIVDTFCVNYTQFQACRFDNMSEEEKMDALRQIHEDKHFRAQFVDNAATLDHMADLHENGYGGRIYFFERALKQLNSSRRAKLLEQKKIRHNEAWCAALAEALPPRTEESVRDKDVNKLIQALQAERSHYKDLAFEVLDFINISPETLAPLPETADNVQGYLNEQVQLWCDAAKRRPLQKLIGFESLEHRSRILSYFCSNVNRGMRDFNAWLMLLIRHARPNEKEECRRLIATFLVNTIFDLRGNNPHPSFEVSGRLLDRMSRGREEAKEDSPYYMSVVAPFIQALEALKHIEEKKRGVQAGDAQLAELVGDIFVNSQAAESSIAESGAVAVASMS